MSVCLLSLLQTGGSLRSEMLRLLPPQCLLPQLLVLVWVVCFGLSLLWLWVVFTCRGLLLREALKQHLSARRLSARRLSARHLLAAKRGLVARLFAVPAADSLLP